MDFFDVSSSQRIKRIEPSKDHHFYGHALFPPMALSSLHRKITIQLAKEGSFIRDWPSGNILQSFNSNGIGPHESVFLNDQVLIIANGGLMTHPREDRDILNLDTMQPNVTYLFLERWSYFKSSFPS